MADEADGPVGESVDDDGKRRRRRRRRRRAGGNGGGGNAGGGNGGGGDGGNAENRNSPRRLTEWSADDDVLIAEGGNNNDDPTTHHGKSPKRKGRRQVDMTGPAVSVPSSGRNPFKKRSTRSRRTQPGSAAARRRRLTRVELEVLQQWLNRMPEHLVAALYKGLGGQPKRVADKDRMIQLATRAITQGSRLGSLLKQLHERDRKALAALLQAGGIAHRDEFLRELILSFGGHEREWQRTMVVLANRGMVVASSEQDGQYFFIIPEPLVDGLLQELAEELVLPAFSHPDVRLMDARPFCPPLDFSVASLATYIDQYSPRLTQRHEIYRNDQEAMDAFFSQIWEPESELFAFHLDFLMMHGIVELRGEYLSLNRDVMEEWLQLEAEDQRDLMFRALDKRFAMAEWVLWAVYGATKDAADTWVAERPLVALYRRWKRGEDWRTRLTRGTYASARTGERQSYSFAGLVRSGILEMGTWGQEKFYRLSPRGRQLLEPNEDDGFHQFYLTPSFEIMAPAGLAPILLFRIGELADLIGCDRANTYKITELSIERALERAWRRDDVLQFLRDNSQIGLPENVEQTLKGWIGHRGDVEFHDLMIMTVHRSQIRRFESNKFVKPYILHRFAPGMYAIDRSRREEIVQALVDVNFAPAKDVRNYPGDPEQVEARANLHRMVADAREAILDPTTRGTAQLEPENLVAVPGTRTAKAPRAEPDLPPEVTEQQAVVLIEKAMSADTTLDMVYAAKSGQRMTIKVEPQRMAFRADSQVLVGVDLTEGERRTFVLGQIERLRISIDADAENDLDLDNDLDNDLELVD